jgi:proline-rich protein PRCC
VTSKVTSSKRVIISTDDGDEVDPKSFFSLQDEDEPNQAMEIEEVKLSSHIEIAPRINVTDVPVARHMPQVQQKDSPQSDMSESQLKKKIASEFGDEAVSDNIEFIDVNVNDHIGPVNVEYMKTISQERQDPSSTSGIQPNSTMKRKHHITFLAHQAKARELSLKEEWARNKATRDQSRARYGFK